MVFKLLNQKLLDEFYSDNVIRTFKGFRLLAIDSSTLRLPDYPELYTAFGEKHSDRSSVPLARISIMFDVLNHITLHGSINPFRLSERDLVTDHISILSSEKTSPHSFLDLLIFDRGYPSLALLFLLNHLKKHFVMRVSHSFLPETNSVIKSGTLDTVVTISSFKDSNKLHRLKSYLPNLSRKATMQIRVLTFDLGNDKKEYIVTSLLDQSLYSYEDIFAIYGLRWNIEENYKFFKCIAQVENFSGKTKIAVEQDFFATIFACNIASLLMMEAQDEIEEEAVEKSLKYKYKINRNILIGTLKNEILEILMGGQNLDEYCTKIKKRIKQHLVPIRPGRSYPRNFRRMKWAIDRQAV